MEATDFEKNIVKVIRQIAEEKALSGNKLSALSGVSQAQISRLYSEKRAISVEQVYKLSTALGYSPAQIIEKALEL